MTVRAAARRLVPRAVTVGLLAAALAAIARPAPAGPAGGDPGRGRTLFSARNCNLCHKLDGKGGSLGPPLDRAGRRLSADQIFRLLYDPRGVNPASHRPNPNLSEDEARHLAAFLAGLR